VERDDEHFTEQSDEDNDHYLTIKRKKMSATGTTLKDFESFMGKTQIATN
jgi:hypothetical protein